MIVDKFKNQRKINVKPKQKSCGGCGYFVKWTNDKYGGGLCEYLDARTKTDYGRECSTWKGIPYEDKLK